DQAGAVAEKLRPVAGAVGPAVRAFGGLQVVDRAEPRGHVGRTESFGQGPSVYAAEVVAAHVLQAVGRVHGDDQLVWTVGQGGRGGGRCAGGGGGRGVNEQLVEVYRNFRGGRRIG